VKQRFLLKSVDKESPLEDNAGECLVTGEDGVNNNTCPSAAASDSGSFKERSSSNSNQQQYLDCGLYLATSSIPNAGWGMYTGKPLAKNQVIKPVDVVIPVVDYEMHQAFLKLHKRLEKTNTFSASTVVSTSRGHHSHRHFHHRNTHNNRNLTIPKVPKWLMEQYYWDCSITHNYYDAEHIDSVVPGLGMLANSHPGMILADNKGPGRPKIIGGRRNAGGGSTLYHGQHFTAEQYIPPGHEIFVEYGDDWFFERFNKTFGLSRDYAAGNLILGQFQLKILDRYHHNNKNKKDNNIQISDAVWKGLQELILSTTQVWSGRLHEVLSRVDMVPFTKDNGEAPRRFVAQNNPTAYASVPTAFQSIEWLKENGMCLDHITVGNSAVAPGERGAFASRFLPKGTMVAPAPVVHMSRDHLKMLLMDEFDSDLVLWQGYQLLLNYVMGHEESSLLFFPYAPAVNLINHYRPPKKTKNSSDKAARPNVKLQWSSKMAHAEWLDWKPSEILAQFYKAGMVMEIIALTDIQQGEEIVLDYGNAWQKAYDYHAAHTPPPPELEPVVWSQYKLWTVNDKQKYPSHVQTVCWIHEDIQPMVLHERAQERGVDIPDTWMPWRTTSLLFLSDSMPCILVGRSQDGAFYNAVVRETFVDPHGHEHEVEVRVADIPRQAITLAPMTYINPELRRDAFRHEIQLPDEMVPDHWRDLKPRHPAEDEDQQQQCNLYMAESSIPNSGWGIYRGYAIPLNPNKTNEIDHFCNDLVIQVEDFALNQLLRNRFHNLTRGDPGELDTWLLSNYAWNAAWVTKGGNLEAERVDSIMPGCGMLANGHPSLYNSQKLPPERMPINTTDPSLGATTHYHNSRFVEQYMKKGKTKIRTMGNGNEIFVSYGEEWFKALHRRSDVGHVPLRSDYVNADKVLRRLVKMEKKHGKKIANGLWDLLWNVMDIFDRKRSLNTLPRDKKSAAQLLEQGGSAKYHLPNRVRSPEWLEQNGQCLDNIQPGPSTIELAGKGAFATRKIQEGQVIAPLPMIHLHRYHMEVYNSADIHDRHAPVWYERQQLLQNYVYGHKESSLLLFPYSPVVNYINHAPSTTRATAGERSSTPKANAKLQWSPQFNTKEWLEKSPDDLLSYENHAGLVMEIVATRTIAPQEEILLDYGEEWEAAWQKHTENWKLAEDWDYQPPVNQWLEWVPTEHEKRKMKISFQDSRSDKWLGCYVELPKKVPPAPKGEKELPEFEWKAGDAMFRSTRSVFPCEVLERITDEDFHYSIIRKDSVFPLKERYTAIITVPSADNSAGGPRGAEDHPPRHFVVHNMPRRAIEFFDEDYSSPQFYPGAFRHEIGIPDSIFPEAWRDLKRTSK
jgi:hypothetical protein